MRRIALLTYRSSPSYYNLATDIYEFAWGQSFHFCRYSVGESFYQAMARHEHYLAHCIGIEEGMKVLDVGCGIGGPAREIAKFTGAHITGLNNNDYQIDRATHHAAREKLSNQLKFVKGDFMVRLTASSCPGALCLFLRIFAPTRLNTRHGSVSVRNTDNGVIANVVPRRDL